MDPPLNEEGTMIVGDGLDGLLQGVRMRNVRNDQIVRIL